MEGKKIAATNPYSLQYRS